MAENDWKIDTRMRKFLGNWITDSTTMDKVSQKIAMAAQKHAYGNIMERMEYFQLEGICKSFVD
jgi:hypothetical protein